MPKEGIVGADLMMVILSVLCVVLFMISLTMIGIPNDNAVMGALFFNFILIGAIFIFIFLQSSKNDEPRKRLRVDEKQPAFYSRRDR